MGSDSFGETSSRKRLRVWGGRGALLKIIAVYLVNQLQKLEVRVLMGLWQHAVHKQHGLFV
ncbi:hypothetical protein NS96R_04985 [Pseudomonas parafulva]|uniref:Uncharacterized protein n=1 Tax=Pseudomonas parafulva TaxID=157782 RepID=A0AAJ0LM46_9PSED|nr:hypothetical protein NS96R_04985 [Pseudomonas parafulva]